MKEDGGKRMSAFSDQIRRTFSNSDNVRDQGLKIPNDVERFTDLPYGTDPKWQVLDIYRPGNSVAYQTAPGKLPVIISVHGGAWIYGDKERYQFYTMSLAEHGFAVVNYTYRLAPEFKFPAGLEDLNLVVKFVIKNAEQYGLDINNIFAVGDSAGGNYLGLYSCIATNEEYAKEYEFTIPEGFCFRAVAFNCACYHVGNSELDRNVMKELMREQGTEEEIEKISVEKYITGQFPPAFVMSGTGDFLKEQLGIIEPVLLKWDVPHEVRFYTAQNATDVQCGTSGKIVGEGESAVLGHVFHLNVRLPEAVRCNDEECAFFRSYL